MVHVHDNFFLYVEMKIFSMLHTRWECPLGQSCKKVMVADMQVNIIEK